MEDQKLTDAKLEVLVFFSSFGELYGMFREQVSFAEMMERPLSSFFVLILGTLFAYGMTLVTMWLVCTLAPIIKDKGWL